MSDGQIIEHSGSSPKRLDDEMQKQEDLWRQAEDKSIPLSEKIAHALFAVTVFVLYFFGTNDSPPVTIMLLWFLAFSSSRYLRQQKQIDALRELLRQAAERR